MNLSDVSAYIREAAIRRGIDPDIALRVARSEGLAPGVWQSNYYKDGRRETSYGPYQLLVGGGLGDKFIEQTGLDPRDESTVFKQVDFALDQAAKGGWSPWYGAAKVGVGNWDGIGKPAGGNLKPSDMPPGLLSGIGSPNTPPPAAAPTMMAGADPWSGMRSASTAAPTASSLASTLQAVQGLLSSSEPQQPQYLPPPPEPHRPQFNGLPPMLSLLSPSTFYR